jgi:putative ABC transport system permease protein
MNVPLPAKAYPKAAPVREFYEQALERISALPGVKSDGISSDLPFHGNETDALQVEGKPGKTPSVRTSTVFGDYLSTMGIPLLRGRGFTPEDRAGSQLVALVSEGAAKALWPGQDAIGKRLTVMGQSEIVVGIVADVNDGALRDKPQPHVYVPYFQLPAVFFEGDNQLRAMNIAVRTTEDPGALTSAATHQVHSLDSDLAVAHIRTMDRELSESVAGPRFNTSLLGIFSVAALLLAGIGIYGVLAYTVAQQTHEIGIRVALGAERRDVMRLVLAQGARIALAGIGIGVLAALGLTRLMASLLYGTSATDPLTFIAVSLLLIAVSLLACYIPARRATKVDPMVALRCE